MSASPRRKAQFIWGLFCFSISGLLGTPSLTAQDPTAQTAVKNVEALGVISAAQPLSGLGFNVDTTNEWEFSLAASAGTTHVRFQCSWVEIESQTAPPANTSAGYALSPNCAKALTLSKKYGMRPTVIAAFGSPFHQILTVSVPNGAAVGATTLNVQFSAGVGGDTLSLIAPFSDAILASNGNQLSSRNSYAGDLITSVVQTDATHATLTLASALNSSLPANSTSTFAINEYLYPPAATTSANDPSVTAYTNYAHFLAQSIAAQGLAGEVEIWNEPPWSPDPWDVRQNFYDTFPGPALPGPIAGNGPNWGFAVALSRPSFSVSGVAYVWAGTNKSADNSLLAPGMLVNTGTLLVQPTTNVTTESIHPYGNNPEDDIWSEACVKSSILPNPLAPQYFMHCNLDSNSTSNVVELEQLNLIAKFFNPNGGIGHSITETGFSLSGGDLAHEARFIMRQFLAYQAIGVTPVEFYRLYDTSPDDLTFTNLSTDAPLPAFTAISGLMADISLIKGNPKTPAAQSNLPSIVSYGGFFPLDTVSIVGSRSGDTANSEIFAIWQRSHVAGAAKWATSSSPTPASVTIAIPTGSAAVSVVNLDTRAPVAFTSSAQQVTLAVSDDPIEVLIEPTAPAPPAVTSISIAPATASELVGAVLNFTCTAKLSDGTTAACTAPVYSSSNAGVASVSANAATGVTAGSATITVTVAGGQSSSAILTVTSLTPTVTSTAIAPATASIAVGSALNFTCTAKLSDGTTAACTSPIYSSSNTAVASISGNTATGVSAGSATITVSVAGIPSSSAVLTVTSVPPAVTSIAIAPATASIAVGSALSFSCTAKLSDGTTAACSTPVYSSSNAGVASVSGNTATGVAPGSATITVSVAGVSSSSAVLTVTSSPPTVTSIAIAPATASVAVGDVLNFSCTAKLSDGTTAACTSPVYSSSNQSVALILGNAATGVAVGSSTITVAGVSSSSAVLTVTTLPPTVTSVTITPSTAAIAVGGVLSYSCTAKFSNGTSGACNSPVYKSSDPAVASGSSNKEKGIAAGFATITVSVSGGPSSSAELTVSAPAPTVTSISIAPGTASIVEGTALTFSCTAVLSDGTTAACTSPVYTSSNPGVASVANNAVTGVTPGSATITVSVGTVSALEPAAVTVTAPAAIAGVLTISPATGNTYGSPVTFTETTPVVAGLCSTATLSFSSSGALLGSATLLGSPLGAPTSCTATITTSNLPVGIDAVAATAPGEGTLGPISSAGTVTVAVAPGYRDTLTVGPTSSVVGSPVTIVFELPRIPGEAVSPTGSVVFASKGATLGTGTLTSTSSGTSAVTTATFVTSSLPTGTDTIAANYAGDKNYGPASPTAIETVTANATPAKPATITASGFAQTYDGAPQGVTVATAPAGIAYEVTYNGSTQTPVEAGTYAVVASITDSSYSAQPATGTLTISKAEPKVTWLPYTTVSSPDVAIGANVLNAQCSVPAELAYTAQSGASGAITVNSASFLPVGDYTLATTCSPTDGKDYASSSTSTSFSVLNDTVFVANLSGEVAAYFNNGTPQGPSSNGGGLGIAVDPSGNVWSINSNGNRVSKFDKSGELITVSSGGGLNLSKAIAVDDAGEVWVVSGTASISSLRPDGTPASAAFVVPDLNGPTSVSIDFKGSVWVANQSNDSITEVIGVAAPTVTPMISGQTQH